MVVKKLKQMFADEGAVSPVIGVILMVAVTVVLAAVIGAFVFGIGDSLSEPAPNAQIGFDYDSEEDTLEVTHDGGDAIDVNAVLSVSGEHDDDAEWNEDVTDADAGDRTDETATVEERITSGTMIAEWDGDTDGVFGGDDSANLHWESPDGDQSTTLGSFSA